MSYKRCFANLILFISGDYYYRLILDMRNIVYMNDVKKSDSTEQMIAEKHLSKEAEKWLNCRLEKNAKIWIAEGVHIEPDLYAEEQGIVCEIFAHIGKLKVGQQHKISQDILKMLLLEKCKGKTYRKIFITADAQIEKYLKGKSFIAETCRQFNIEVKRIELSSDIIDSIFDAQKRQEMVNK